MLRRWTLLAVPISTGDRDIDALSQSVSDAANADPGVFWTRRGAERAARFHMQMLPISLTPERRQP
jgi:hypothetical protein